VGVWARPGVGGDLVVTREEFPVGLPFIHRLFVCSSLISSQSLVNLTRLCVDSVAGVEWWGGD
jgi:hypothetical protein